MKILRYEENNNSVIVSMIFDDMTYATRILAKSDRESNLKDFYILTKDTERMKFEGDTQNLENWNPNPKPTLLKVDSWHGLKARVYDQYGDLMDIKPNFRVEGASIVDDRLSLDAVTDGQEYTIYCSVDNLEESRAFIKSKTEQVLETSESKIEKLEQALKTILGGI